jgi:hypothetical protein
MIPDQSEVTRSETEQLDLPRSEMRLAPGIPLSAAVPMKPHLSPTYCIVDILHSIRRTEYLGELSKRNAVLHGIKRNVVFLGHRHGHDTRKRETEAGSSEEVQGWLPELQAQETKSEFCAPTTLHSYLPAGSLTSTGAQTVR